MGNGTRTLLDDCFLHDKDRLRHVEALGILKDRLNCIVGSEVTLLENTAQRVLAQTIVAPRNVPLNDNAAVDGYAYRAGDFAPLKGLFPVSARIAAGDLALAPLAKMTAARIFTGASLPPGADTVVMQEDCTLDDEQELVSIPAGLKQGANCRLAGEDLAKGDILLTMGEKLRPQDIAALASIGQESVKVFAPLNVALISTGDELRRPGEEISSGQVYDSNHFLLRALLETTSAAITDCGIVADMDNAVESAIVNAAGEHDVIITTGGASRGEEDHVTSTLDRLGKRHMWQMAIKPGRPMMFGQIPRNGGHCLFFGLPGNPVAAMVCFLLYVKPALDVLSGQNWREPVRYPLPADFEIKHKKPDRREFLRGMLVQNDNGSLGVARYPRDGSGIISSLRDADGLIEIAEDVTSLQKGETVSFIPFSEFGIV